MADNVIGLEDLKEPLLPAFQRLMGLIPVKQREDVFLQRLVAVRLNLDGEDPTREYLLRKIEHAVQCNYTGSLFDFLKDDHEETACLSDSDGPGAAG